jgi:hypothetical protein
MESLAMLVAILFLIDIFAGPIAILLTWGKIVGVIESRPKALALALTVIRRLLHGFLVTIGFLIGGWLSYIAVTPAKLFGIFSLMTSYIGLRREYFPEFLLLQEVMNLLGLNKKTGRSSSRDENGPAGQH